MSEDKKTYGGTVALLGRPNAGKSTLLNRLLGKKVSIVSDKPQTTRKRVLGILTKDDRQIIFIDTPGKSAAAGRLAAAVNRVADEAPYEADILVWMIDAKTGVSEKDRESLAQLDKMDKPLAVVFNKMDLAKTGRVVPWVAELQAAYKIDEFFPLSAKTGDNTGPLENYLLGALPENPFLYAADEKTPQDTETLVAEFVREQVYLNSHSEIPYAVTVETQRLAENEDGSLAAEVILWIDNPRHRPILVGQGGAFIRKVRLFASKRLKEYFGKKVTLELWIKVKKGRPRREGGEQD
jgi:GTP-binding protein Era